VEARVGPGHRGGDDREQAAAQELQRPRGVEEVALLAALVSNDARQDPDVAQHLEALLQDQHEQHQAVRLREEEARDDDVAAEAQELDAADVGEAQQRAAYRARLERGRAGRVGLVRRHPRGPEGYAERGRSAIRTLPCGPPPRVGALPVVTAARSADITWLAALSATFWVAVALVEPTGDVPLN